MAERLRKDDGTFIDADDIAVEADAVADVGALTATAPAAATATNPSAPSAYEAVTNMSDPVTKAQGEAVSAALKTLRDEVAAYELVISALVVDNADLRTKLAAAVADLATQRTKINAILAEMRQGNQIASS